MPYWAVWIDGMQKMIVNFSKMHGLSNDFVVLDATQKPIDLDLNHKTIERLSHRKTGIGFDQLLVVEPSTHAGIDFRYRIFNADGSEVEHCGNGARCFAKFVIDKGLTDKYQLTVAIQKGLLNISYYSDTMITVNMGEPVLSPSMIPFVHSAADSQSHYALAIDRQTVQAAVLSMGNPHAVILVDDVWQYDIDPLSKAIQASPYFPQSVNINYVEIINTRAIALRTYERGVGETYACGSGACAAAYALARLQQRVHCPLMVSMRGGDLQVDIDDNNHILITGPAVLVYDGYVYV